MTEIGAIDADADGRDEDINADQDADAAEAADPVGDLDPGEVADEDEDVVAGIDFNMDNLTVPEQVAKGRKMVEAIRQLPDYANKVPKVEELAASIDAMERTYRAAQFAEFEAQVASRKAREAEQAYWDAIKDKPRH